MDMYLRMAKAISILLLTLALISCVPLQPSQPTGNSAPIQSTANSPGYYSGRSYTEQEELKEPGHDITIASNFQAREVEPIPLSLAIIVEGEGSLHHDQCLETALGDLLKSRFGFKTHLSHRMGSWVSEQHRRNIVNAYMTNHRLTAMLRIDVGPIEFDEANTITTVLYDINHVRLWKYVDDPEATLSWDLDVHRWWRGEARTIIWRIEDEHYYPCLAEAIIDKVVSDGILADR